jgi:hypothetical protein
MIGTERSRGDQDHLKKDPLAALLGAVADVAAAAWIDPGLSSYRRQGVGLQARLKTNSPVYHQGEGAIPVPQQKYKRNWTTMRGRNEHPGGRSPLNVSREDRRERAGWSDEPDDQPAATRN